MSRRVRQGACHVRTSGRNEGKVCPPAPVGWMVVMPRSRHPRSPMAWLMVWPLCCLICTFCSGQSPRGDTYAFLVGVADYESKDELKPLKFACDDVISFAGVLRNSGVPAKNIVLLHDRQSILRFKP